MPILPTMTIHVSQDLDEDICKNEKSKKKEKGSNYVLRGKCSYIPKKSQGKELPLPSSYTVYVCKQWAILNQKMEKSSHSFWGSINVSTQKYIVCIYYLVSQMSHNYWHIQNVSQCTACFRDIPKTNISRRQFSKALSKTIHGK